jgi:hypothetical protein
MYTMNRRNYGIILNPWHLFDALHQFSIRCINNLLPTIENLRKRNLLYESMVCLLCKKENETLIHLTTCSALQRNWKALEDEITKKLLKHVNKRSEKQITYQVLNQVIFKYNDPALTLLQQRNRSELTRGLLSHTINTKLCRL